MKFIKSLQFIFKPSYWVLNHDYNAMWDITLNHLLDKYNFTMIDEFTAKLGDTIIWVRNQPYATMRPYSSNWIIPIRPSRLTIKRAINKLNNDYLVNLELNKSAEITEDLMVKNLKEYEEVLRDLFSEIIKLPPSEGDRLYNGLAVLTGNQWMLNNLAGGLSSDQEEDLEDQFKAGIDVIYKEVKKIRQANK